MTRAEQLAAFVARASYDALSQEAREALRVRVLDSLGCAIGAVEGEPPRLVRAHVRDFDRAGRATLIGGGRTAPDHAAFYNGALIRYLDFNDAYVAKGESCHPSDNLGAVLAATEYAARTGEALLAALAVAYQVQCRLSDVAPVRHRGFDHTTQGSYAVAAGVAKALELDQARTANALAIAGTAFNALRVTRTGALSHWKGLAYPNTAFGATHATFLAAHGVTGPPEVFEGNKGFMDAIAGPFELDWAREDLERVTRTGIKKFNAEFHSQSALEAVLELRQAHGVAASEVMGVEIDIFDVAYHIIGGGEEGAKTLVRSKEEADHSLPYMIAVALLDGQVMPDQYREERVQRKDVQALLRRVSVRPSDEYSRRFPDEMPCRVAVTLRDGRVLVAERRDFEGFPTRPAGWATVVDKFDRLAEPYTTRELRARIVATVERLATVPVANLTALLARVRIPRKEEDHDDDARAPAR
ncbi:MAG: MmgE/PrpD family protein [Candidatus Rokuibacteriota bacterium]